MSEKHLNFLYNWKETYELSFELADTTFIILNEVVTYCRANNIPIHQQKGLWNMVTKARSIIASIEQVNSSKFDYSEMISRRTVTGKYGNEETDDKETEPYAETYRG